MWAVAILAMMGLIVNVVLHVATFVGVDPLDWARPEWVEALGFWVFFAAVVILANVVEDRRQKRAKSLGVTLPDENPRGFRIFMRFVIAYAVLLGVYSFFIDSRRGDAVRAGGGAYAIDPGHGRPMIPISADEFHRIRRNNVRGVSAVMILFYLQIAFDMIFTMTGRKYFAPQPGRLRRMTYLVVTIRR